MVSMADVTISPARKVKAARVVVVVVACVASLGLLLLVVLVFFLKESMMSGIDMSSRCHVEPKWSARARHAPALAKLVPAAAAAAAANIAQRRRGSVEPDTHDAIDNGFHKNMVITSTACVVGKFKLRAR